jgi:hypothetical protein
MTLDRTQKVESLIGDVNPEELDSILSNKLKQMTIEDRENIQDEIHGIKSLAPTETPERIEEALRLLDVQIKRLVLSDVATSKAGGDGIQQDTLRIRNQVLLGTSYDLAQVKQYSYLLDADFRLKFLRADLFDARKAATRFMMYLDLLVENFGAIGLQRPLRISDLGPAERAILRSGVIQLLPTRDRRGRRIMNIFGFCGTEYPVVHKTKFVQYLIDVLSQDLETQKQGVVLLFWGVPEMSPYHKEYKPIPDMEGEKLSNAKLFASPPVRISAVHFCSPDNTFFRFVSGIVIVSMGMDQRVRVRTHCGNIMECRYWLMTFGIPVEDLPVTDTGKIKVKYLQQWVKGRETMDLLDRGNISRKRLVECPNLQDVLFSNGGNRWTFQGNVTFREILEAKGQAYSTKTNDEKSSTIEEVIEQIRGMNGRFLVWEKEKGCWVVIDDDLRGLKLRVGAALREHMRRIAERDKNTQSSCSDTSKFLNGRALKRQRCDGQVCLLACGLG